MTAIKSPIEGVQSLDALTKNQSLVVIRANNAKCHLEVAMSYNEITNQLEQEYYNKASGCSVKSQKNNLFDYKYRSKK